MTNQEFINNLSPKAKEIINGEYTKRTNKNIEVNLDDKYTRVITDNPNKYIILVQRRENFYDMEYGLLHEFSHCVQLEEGFPDVHFVDKKYQEISNDISTVVLDQDVYNRLIKQGYTNPSYFKDTYDEFKYLINLISTSKNSIILTNKIDKRIWIACKLILLQMAFQDDNLIGIINTIKKKMPLVYKTYNTINTAIQTYGFNTPNGALKSFETIIDELGLKGKVSIVK